MQKTKSRSGNASRSNDCDRCASCVDDVTLVDDVDTGGCLVILIGRKRKNYIPCTVYYRFPYMQFLHAHLHILSFSPRCRAGRLNDAKGLASRCDVTRSWSLAERREPHRPDPRSLLHFGVFHGFRHTRDSRVLRLGRLADDVDIDRLCVANAYLRIAHRSVLREQRLARCARVRVVPHLLK